MGEEADADWQDGLVEWGRESVLGRECPIDDPHFCLGVRCQINGVCDFNRRRRVRERAK